MIKKVQQDFGSLDILCNNVGIQYVAPVHEFPDDKWDAMIAITMSSAFHATKAALPAMMEKQWGRIVNTGSMHALVASPYKSAYNTAKHGIAGGLVWQSNQPAAPPLSLRKLLNMPDLSCMLTVDAVLHGWLATQ